MAFFNLLQIASPVQIPLDGKATSLAIISTGLFIWTSITFFLSYLENKKRNENIEKLLTTMVALQATSTAILATVTSMQTWQKQTWKKLEEVARVATENHEQSSDNGRALESFGHQIEMVAQNQLAATNGLQQVINRMLDILRDVASESKE